MFAGDRIQSLLHLPDAEALVVWLGLDPDRPMPARPTILARLSVDIAYVDQLIAEQLDAVLHHESFQALEAAWRGVQRLAERIDDDDNVKVRVLDLSWPELVRDAERAIEFDQSHLFRLIYSREFGMAGGEPFGVMIGNYAIHHRRTQDHPQDDLGALRAISEVAAAAFCPFVAAAHPSFFGLTSYRALERRIDLDRTFANDEYAAWQRLRARDESRFIGLTLPRVLMRQPYRDNPLRADGFVYREDVTAPDGSGFLWGNAAFAFAEVLIRAFIDDGWMAGIRGVRRDFDGGGILTDLVHDAFQVDGKELVSKGSLEVKLQDDQERELSELGFIPLSHCHGTDRSAFYANQSIQSTPNAAPGRPRTVEEINKRLSAMLQYIFCVSRFAHYVKIIGRDKVGSFATATELENLLNDWLVTYATSNEDVSDELQAKYPLREARVEVQEVPGRRGAFKSVVHLRPHYQFDQMTSAVTLVTELIAGREA